MESLCLMCRNYLELTLLVVVLNNIKLTYQILLKLATSDFGLTFHSVICKLEKWRQAQEGFSCLVDPKPSSQGRIQQCTHRSLGSTVWAAVRYKAGPKPSCSAKGMACLGPKLCVPCLSSPDLNFVLLSPKQILFQMPRSAFSPLFRGIEKPPRLSNHSLRTRDILLRNSSHVHLKLVFAGAEFSPHPLQPIPAESCECTVLPGGRAAHPPGWQWCSSSRAHLECAVVAQHERWGRGGWI